MNDEGGFLTRLTDQDRLATSFPVRPLARVLKEPFRSVSRPLFRWNNRGLELTDDPSALVSAPQMKPQSCCAAPPARSPGAHRSFSWLTGAGYRDGSNETWRQTGQPHNREKPGESQRYCLAITAVRVA